MFPTPHLSSPFLWRGLRVGLLGGSFNPPHLGHVHAAEVALTYLNLDCVWWLVSTGNPFKADQNSLPLQSRIDLCRSITHHHPRMIVTNLEQQMGTVRSFDTVCGLQKNFPYTEFIWLSGTDIAFEFHKWHHSQKMIKRIPFAFIGRPTAHGLVRNNMFKKTSGLIHKILNNGGNFPLSTGHVYWLLGENLKDISSTLLRRNEG